MDLSEQLDSEAVLAITTAVVFSVLKIGLLVAVGVRLEKNGMLNGPKRQCLSALAMDVCLPCLLFSKVLPNASTTLLYEGWPLLFWPFIYAPVGALLGAVCSWLVGIPARHLGSAAACAAFPNASGFPVSIITALGPALPDTDTGISAITFLSLVQLTDGILKYTLGPAVFRRDLRARQKWSKGNDAHEHHGPLASLGASLRSIGSVSIEQGTVSRSASNSHTKALLAEHRSGGDHLPVQHAAFHHGSGQEQCAASDGSGSPSHHLHLDHCHHHHHHHVQQPDKVFGLDVEQTRVVEPEWSRFDSYLCFTACSAKQSPITGEPIHPGHTKQACAALAGQNTPGSHSLPDIESSDDEEGEDSPNPYRKFFAEFLLFLRQLFPPQVTAVIVALAIGLSPACVKALIVPAPTSSEPAPLAFVHGFTKELGAGFVPLQMIALGGRLVNVVSDNGPLAPHGAAGKKGRSLLLRISGAVSFARMIICPVVLYGICLLVKPLLEQYAGGDRPLSFWAVPLIVAAMPTANNMSTMADLIGAGRSVSAASTAMQLIASPVVLALSLTLLIAGAQFDLA